eukprot:1157256-Pelagomonas_calceolata.AAC.3
MISVQDLLQTHTFVASVVLALCFCAHLTGTVRRGSGMVHRRRLSSIGHDSMLIQRGTHAVCFVQCADR